MTRNPGLMAGFMLAKYEVVLTVEEPLLLPAYKGATLRGSFGGTLKRIGCYRDPATCEARPPECQCPYGFLFAPKTPEGGHRFRAGEEIARPFVIEPPPEDRRAYRPGEKVIFHLLLFGKACQYLPYFLVAFHELPPIGIPPRRGRVTLQEVWAVHDLSGIKQRVYQAADRTVRHADLAISPEQLARAASQYPPDRLTLEFETNTILRYLSRPQGVRRIEFGILISRLLQRIETLASLYGEGLPEDGQETARRLIQAARTVRIVRDETAWNEWKRYSTRQKQEVWMDGVIGKVTYEGELSPFLPLLLLGQYTHVGKGCVFGLGKFVVQT